MKKLLVALTLVLFSSSAFAGSCLKLVGKVDEKNNRVIKTVRFFRVFILNV